MDVFYPLIPSVRDSIEFRYSLRSLKNIQPLMQDVIVVGSFPEWLQGVIKVPFQDIRKDRISNVIRKTLLACEVGKSNEMIVMSDDIFITQPTEIKYYRNSRSLKDLVNRKKNTPYKNSLLAVLQIFPNGITGFTHTPFQVNKQLFLDLDKKYNLLKYKFNIFTLYMNEYSMFGYQPISNCKVTQPGHWERAVKNTFCSCNNRVAGTSEFSRIMEEVFPEKSIYEV